MSFASPAVELPSFSFSSLHQLNRRTYAWAGIILLTILAAYNSLWGRKYKAIPAICSASLLSSYGVATRFPMEGREWLYAGYNKYKSRAFRIPQGDRWHIIVSGEKLVEELRKAPDDALSFVEAISQMFQAKFTMGPTILTSRYHVALIRSQLTRNLGALFSSIREEIILSIENNVPLNPDWTSIEAYPAVLQIVSRTSSRIFVGAPLCRNPEYTALSIRHTLEVFNGSRILLYFPTFLKPLVAKLLTNVPTSIQKAHEHLRPIIEERQKKIDEYGPDYPDKPNDFLAWLMDEARGEERSSLNLTNRILHLNFSAIHTSSMSFTHALFHLAAQPEYIEPLRKEIETIVAQKGWSKASLNGMHKLDSFFKESGRINGLSAVSMTRIALKDVRFSDGTFVPKGAMVSAAAEPLHHDDEIYNDGDTFDGFRFSNRREPQGKGATNQFVATKPDYLAFGYGSHACPGRFFVANEMKLIMAQLLLTYDIKLENEGVRPQNAWYGFACVPDTKASVLFRRRQT